MLNREADAGTFRSPFDERAGGPRDKVLDGLRAVAVLAVVAGHAALFRFGTMLDAAAPELRSTMGSVAVTGVRIFFLISGYVITRLLLIEYRERGAVSLAKFYTRRITRIIPPFAVYLGAVLLLSRAGYFSAPPSEIAAAGAFICNTNLHPCTWFVGHSWSLAVEEQFYLLWPMLLMIVTPRWRPPFLSAIALALLAIAFYRGGGSFNNEISFLFIVLGAFMAANVGLQRLFVSWVSAPVWLGAALAFAAASLFALDAAMIVLGPLLLTIFVFGAANFALLAALLKSRPFQIVGGCSYSLYLWQQLFLGASTHYSGPPPPLWGLPVAVWLSWQFIEKPGIALGRAWTRPAPATAKAETHFT